MKRKQLARIAALVLFSSFILHPSSLVHAATTINTTNKFDYGANLGWMDWRGETNSGAVISQYTCSGYIWSANVGWIHLGDNAPANGLQYQNNSATDYGVNRDDQGYLSGLAYGANIGWVVFTNATAVGPLASTNLPRVDLASGKFNGYIYSANCGWISLSNAIAFVQTGDIPVNDSDHDGLPDAWELTYAPNLNQLTGSGDFDHDGFSDLEEYVADTNPVNANNFLAITAYSVATISGTDYDTLTWNSRPTRQYIIQSRTDLDPNFPFTDATGALTPDAGTNTTRTVAFGVPSPQRFFRIQAILPPSP